MTKKHIGFVLLFMVPAFMFGQGNTTFDFLRIDVSARAAALGGTLLTSTDDPNVIFYNPAGLATLKSKKFSIGFFKHLLDINAGYASYGMEVNDFGFVGAGVVYINYGEFQRRGEEGQDLGTFGAGEFAFIAGFADRLLQDLNYGVNAKFIYSSIAEAHSTAAAIDFGVQYAALPERILVGASVNNLGTQIDPYFTTKEKLPLDVRVGASVYPEHLPAVIMIDFHKLNESYNTLFERFKQFSIGVEFFTSPNFDLRIGYNNEKRQELKLGQTTGLAGFSAGGGFSNEMYSFDYAFNSLGKIGALHRISIGLKFD